MNILTIEEINKISEKRDFIISSNMKVMEKNTKYLSLFFNYYEKMFKVLGNDIDLHLEYINRVIKISIPKAKYLHYIKTNFPTLYNEYILLLEPKEVKKVADSIELDEGMIFTKGISLYNNPNDDMKKENDETEELLKILQLKRETIKDFKIRKFIRFGNTLSLTFILCSIIYLM